MLRTRVLFAFLILLPLRGLAENGANAWLRYAPLSPPVANRYSDLPAGIVVLGDSPLLRSARTELVQGIQGMLGRSLRAITGNSTEPAIVVGTVEQVRKLDPGFATDRAITGDAYALRQARFGGRQTLIISGASERGVLYGTFALLRKIAQGEALLDEVQAPSAPLRWVNQWDNLDGSIERGYAGNSIFFDHGKVRSDLSRATAYARLLASIGVNGCTVNNVNADVRVLEPEFIPQLARIAEAFRPYGVRLGIAVNVATPELAGGLGTFDPLDPKVAQWWQKKFDDLYRQIPDFGGLVVKADSEGQLGPSVYGRSPADAANVIARALKPHGGVAFYRAFVYNHHLDWNDPKADRARAAYDIFHPLDGKFEDNVVVQIKHGPIDFQVREPASPLFGGLQKTDVAIELQITQEYTGQQRHTVFLLPMWKEVLDFDMAVDGQTTRVKEIVGGRAFRRSLGGYVGVANAGLSMNWMGNHLAMANLYGFGRLAWSPQLSSQSIAEEWTKLTFGNNPDVVQNVTAILLASWPVYEIYTGPLGLQTLTNITGPHYGPAPESQERNGWGQWIRAEDDGVGMDRTVPTGTGFVGQYPAAVQKIYELPANTPDELVLFFHHLPYRSRLRSGKTVIQSIYDFHYEGADKAAEFVTQWEPLKDRIDDERYEEVLAQLRYQAGHAIVWRDAINDWFKRISGIPDDKGRVGHHAGRIEAESMELQGYETFEPVSWEGASGGKAVRCPETAKSCLAQTTFQGAAGQYHLDVEYFDLPNGAARFKVFVGQQKVDEWRADMVLPGDVPSADSSVQRKIKGLSLSPGDVIRVEVIPEGGDRGSLDYVEISEGVR